MHHDARNALLLIGGIFATFIGLITGTIYAFGEHNFIAGMLTMAIVYLGISVIRNRF